MKYMVLRSNVEELKHNLAFCVLPMNFELKSEIKRYMAAYDSSMRITETLQEMRFGTHLSEWISGEGLLSLLVLYPDQVDKGKLLVTLKDPVDFYDHRAVDTKKSHMIVDDNGFIGFSIVGRDRRTATTVTTLELSDLNECA